MRERIFHGAFALKACNPLSFCNRVRKSNVYTGVFKYRNGLIAPPRDQIPLLQSYRRTANLQTVAETDLGRVGRAKTYTRRSPPEPPPLDIT